jgi:hypothetical protein
MNISLATCSREEKGDIFRQTFVATYKAKRHTAEEEYRSLVQKQRGSSQ